MKSDIKVRITVQNPLGGVAMQVQKGRDGLVQAAAATVDSAVFEFDITVDTSGERPNFLGKFAQGPKDARFIYINSGTSAGQHFSCWTRRAKVSLMTVTSEQIREIINTPGAVLSAAIWGLSKDGGPACASVKLLEDGWKVV